MIDLSLFTPIRENVFLLKKWNWNYEEVLLLQNLCVDFVRENPQTIFLIFCSHPHCFTLGRGLQKNEFLIEFDQTIKLPYPLHQIKRGGGLTFHYPGQIVFYPILNLTYLGLGVVDLMIEILALTKKILWNQFEMNGLSIRKDLFGLWYANEFSKAKIASIGVAASRFITYHGLALNFYNDDIMFKELQSLHPCGLPGDIYRSVETLLCKQLNSDEREIFISAFIHEFKKMASKDYLITDKQRSSSAILDSISF